MLLSEYSKNLLIINKHTINRIEQADVPELKAVIEEIINLLEIQN